MPNKITFIQDFFMEDHSWGGAEIADDTLIKKLIDRGHEVERKHSEHVTVPYIKERDNLFIVSNFIRLSEDARYALMSKKYIIYEHDSKWNRARDISAYPDYKVPADNIINFNFYESAHKVILQSKRHLELTKKNLGLSNLISAGGNPWSDESLEFLESLQSVEKTRDYAILEHPYPQKNFHGAIDFAIKNRFDFGVIYQQDQKGYLEQLAKFKSLIFIPKVFETFGRTSCEARCLGLDVLTNANVSFFHEGYASLKGMELIERLRQNTSSIVDLFEV